MFSGKKLRELRKAKCLTWKALAERVGVSLRMVSKWEREGREPRASTLMKLAEALGVDVKELFE